ncbi:MAG TPA: zf-TFIIB domain-containing protein [Candidatus Binatia bacterium]|jgi:Zn-finger nucleic acid-binding protein
MSAMRCPKCRTETMNVFSVEGVALERCSSCSGIWFDARELSQLLEQDARHLSSLRRGRDTKALEGKKGFCPRDDSELLRVYSSINRSVIIDACADCRGIWLDGGEFEKLFSARQL